MQIVAGYHITMLLTNLLQSMKNSAYKRTASEMVANGRNKDASDIDQSILANFTTTRAVRQQQQPPRRLLPSSSRHRHASSRFRR